MPGVRCLFLNGMNKEKPKLLTVKFDIDTLAEFGAAVEVLRAGSVSEYVHRFVMRSIEEARSRVSPAEFAEIAGREKQEILERSEMRSKERK